MITLATKQETAPAILRPWIAEEAIDPKNAAALAGVTVQSIYRWAERHGIGRRRVNAWWISRVALAMLLDDRHDLLARYLAGDRASAAVREYFEREGVPLPGEPPVARPAREALRCVE